MVKHNCQFDCRGSLTAALGALAKPPLTKLAEIEFPFEHISTLSEIA